MKFLSGVKDMLLPTVVVVKASNQYDFNRPIQHWYDNSVVPGIGSAYVIYQLLIVDDQGDVVLIPWVMTKSEASTANIQPDGWEGERNTHGQIYPPVLPNIDVSKVSWSPLSNGATWLPEVKPDNTDLLVAINSKLDRLLKAFNL